MLTHAARQPGTWLIYNVGQKTMKLRVHILLAIFALTLSCTRKPDMSQPHIALADKFARALGAGSFDQAHALLTDDQKKALSVGALKKDYEEMIAYGPGPSKHIEVMQALDTWPEKKKGDIGWVYVAIAGDSFSEAATVVVARTGAGLVIRSIEWGRP